MLTLNDGRSELWQWDTGRKLTVDTDCSQVHFSNKVFGRSIDVDVVDGAASIPDILLQIDNDLTAWAFVGTPENGYTKISKIFKVNKRNKPADYVFTPPEQTTLGELIERIDKIEESQGPDAIKNAVDDYLANNPIEIDETDPTVPEWAKQNTKPSYTASDVGADPTGTAAKAVSEHNTDTAAHNDLRLEVKSINDRLTAFFDSDDQTLDELSEIVAYITSNKTLIDSITTNKVSVADIVNNLTTNAANKPLSAAQGVALKGLIDGLSTGKLDANKLQDAINTALAQAKESGEFDGADGKDGQDGSPGKDGSNGVSATHSWNGTVLTVTSASGTSSADLKGATGNPGKDGSNGQPGADGVSPTVAVSKSGKVTTVAITDKNGTKTVTINDGADGSPGSAGKDGTSVTVKSVSESTADGGSNVVTFSDGKTLAIRNGSKGSKGDKGDKGDTGPEGPKGDTGPAYTLNDTDKNTIAAVVKASLSASDVMAGTFAGQVVANSSWQTPSTSLLRNSKLVSAETNPTVNGEINWTYE